MSKSTKVAAALPVGQSPTARTVDEAEQIDAEVLAFRTNFEGRSALDELIRTGGADGEEHSEGTRSVAHRLNNSIVEWIFSRQLSSRTGSELLYRAVE